MDLTRKFILVEQKWRLCYKACLGDEAARREWELSFDPLTKSECLQFVLWFDTNNRLRRLMRARALVT